MEINEYISDYLNRSAKSSNSIILLTDKNKIIYNSENITDKLELPKEYIKHLNKMHSKDITLEVCNKNRFNLISKKYNINNECIALILYEKEILGSLIILNHTLDFECKNFVFMSSLLRSIKFMLKNEIRN